MLGPTLGVSSPTPKTRENFRVSICPETLSFQGTAPTIA